MASNDQIKAYIQKLVKEEVAKIAPQLIRETLSKGLGQLIIEAADTMTEREISPVRGNSKKRVALTESYDAEEFPTVTGRVFDTDRMAELTGYGDLKKNRSITGITIDHAITEAGNPIPIRPDQIPDSVQTALNKDYRPLMAAWNNKKNG